MNTHLHRVTKIWDQAPHNAFTGLTHFQGGWFCTFREGLDHLSTDGHIRVIASTDSKQWSSVALFASPDPELPDLRDPKIMITPDLRLLVTGAATSRDEKAGRKNYAWFSKEGSAWSEPQLMSDDKVWIWSLTHSGQAFYGAGYGPGAENSEVTLYSGQDVLLLKRLTVLHSDAQFPNETALLMEGDKGLALVRRELGPGETVTPPSRRDATALLAKSEAPFTAWATHDLGIFVGGPALIRLPNGKVVVGGRKNTNKSYMALWELDEENESLTEILILPSGNDCSYPGLVWHDDRLWVSYYSGHEGKPSIYLAELEIC